MGSSWKHALGTIKGHFHRAQNASSPEFYKENETKIKDILLLNSNPKRINNQ